MFKTLDGNEKKIALGQIQAKEKKKVVAKKDNSTQPKPPTVM